MTGHSLCIHCPGGSPIVKEGHTVYSILVVFLSVTVDRDHHEGFDTQYSTLTVCKLTEVYNSIHLPSAVGADSSL